MSRVTIYYGRFMMLVQMRCTFRWWVISFRERDKQESWTTSFRPGLISSLFDGRIAVLYFFVDKFFDKQERDFALAGDSRT